jgi:large-conductance mechanosensitive channel
MGLFRRSQDEENEVSGGQVFGYALIGAAVLFVVAFIIFVIVSKVSNKSDNSSQASNNVVIEQVVETDLI